MAGGGIQGRDWSTTGVDDLPTSVDEQVLKGVGPRCSVGNVGAVDMVVAVVGLQCRGGKPFVNNGFALLYKSDQP